MATYLRRREKSCVQRTSVRISSICFSLICRVPVLALAQKGRRNSDQRASATSSCYDPQDPGQVRLWEGVPGAVGDDPCRDIPFVQLYRSIAGANLAAILIIPGDS